MKVLICSKVLAVKMKGADDWEEWHLATGEVVAAGPWLTAQVPLGKSAQYGYYIETEDGKETWAPHKPNF